MQFKSEFGNKEFMVWATVSSQLCFCWLYKASPYLAAKNIISLILVLTIWWCPGVESSLVLLEEGAQVLSPSSGPNAALDAADITAGHTSTTSFPFPQHGKPPTLTAHHKKEFTRMQKVFFPFLEKYIFGNTHMLWVYSSTNSYTLNRPV